MKLALTVAALACTAGLAAAAPVTWSINEPWDFYTSTNPAQGNLVGTITFDRAVSEFYPASWSFTLEHHDPAMQPYYPITIAGTYPNVSTSGAVTWTLPGQNSASMQTWLNIGFGGNGPNIYNILLDGTAPSVTFGANEWVWRNNGFNASSRLINGGTMTLVPAPASLAAFGALAALARRRR